ncbi:ABC transporter permease [Falsiroseomonas sp. HW251]|uniref:ABC transporter permease n=1 Tax=Falsiroseomonas sp. HW251 TaxID=3390998 RepID=UPI003D323B6A
MSATAVETGAKAERDYASAGQARLIWWRFRKHRLAVASGIVVILFYLIAAFADLLAYADPHASDARRGYVPPQMIRLFTPDGEFRPHVQGLRGVRNMQTFRLEYRPDPDRIVEVQFFARGYDYDLFGLIPTNIHLLGLKDPGPADGIFLLGTDVQGRDLWSRLMVATRVSLTIGLVGVTISLFLGVLLGGISAIQGGWVDLVIQRVIEIIRSLPTIPLWMGLVAALPTNWSVTQIYFAITVLIAFLAWTDLARVVRGKFLSLKTDDFVLAAELAGASQMRIIFKHMLPSFASHVIAATTLALPAMIISETSLSFLGLGLRPPAISWGILLQDAQNIQTLALAPWLLAAAVPVILVILAFNFLGDGLRDAADPYGS